MYARSTLIDEKKKEKEKEKEQKVAEIDEEESDEVSYGLDAALHRIEMIRQAQLGTEEVLEQGSLF